MGMMQTVFYGNGLNLLNDGTKSWEDLLNDIAKDELDKKIPNTLKYEAIILKQPYREDPVLLLTSDNQMLITSDNKLLYASGEIIEIKLKKDIAERVSKYESNEIYDEIAKLPAEHFITTNYDNTLFKAMGDNSVLSKERREITYSIWRHYTLKNTKQYWPIHGNVDSPQSIMLGFDHYSGALSRIESYVKGGLVIPKYIEHKEFSNDKMPSIVARLDNMGPNPYSWIDLFFCSDVHIIGFGLDYSEMDLWWILNKRERIKQKDEGLIKNKIIFYPTSELSNDKRQLLEGFEVEVCGLNNYPKGKWMDIYKELLEMMKSNMDKRSK